MVALDKAIAEMRDITAMINAMRESNSALAARIDVLADEIRRIKTTRAANAAELYRAALSARLSEDR